MIEIIHLVRVGRVKGEYKEGSVYTNVGRVALIFYFLFKRNLPCTSL